MYPHSCSVPLDSCPGSFPEVRPLQALQRNPQPHTNNSISSSPQASTTLLSSRTSSSFSPPLMSGAPQSSPRLKLHQHVWRTNSRPLRCSQSYPSHQGFLNTEAFHLTFDCFGEISTCSTCFFRWPSFVPVNSKSLSIQTLRPHDVDHIHHGEPSAQSSRSKSSQRSSSSKFYSLSRSTRLSRT